MPRLQAFISASSATGPGGQVTLDGGNTGHLFTSGRQLATGSVGGSIALFGQDIVLSGATVDASGSAGGGSVQIGGSSQEGNAAASDPETVTVTPASTIRADALDSGSGGQVSVWAEQTTTFAGTVSARGGPDGGSGGFIDLSGQGDLSYAGSADAAAPLGKSGTLLIDPKNITISADPDVAFPQYSLIDPHPTADGSFGSMVSVLNNGNVVVTNPHDDFGGMNAGAVYLFDGSSAALISTLVGSSPGDEVASGIFTGSQFVNAVIPLTNGNYVVLSPNWDGERGAVTWGSGEHEVSGMISAANSLVGSNPGDRVGTDFTARPITPLSDGNYVVSSINWNNHAGQRPGATAARESAALSPLPIASSAAARETR